MSKTSVARARANGPAPEGGTSHSIPQRAEVRRALNSPKLQPKLEVGPPDDEFEREADRVADEVTRGGAAEVSSAPPRVQRACACGGTCDDCRQKEEEKLRRATAESAGPAPSEAPRSVRDVLRSPGRPLDPAARSFFEPRFGRDFGGVRIHTGSQAEASARDVSALAYTVGDDIVFGAGRYAPGTSSGDHLLAHELTHVVQQVRGLRRKTVELACGSGSADGSARVGPWPADVPVNPAIGDPAYWITSTWKEGDTKDSYYTRLVESWIGWRFGSVPPAARSQILKILSPAVFGWREGVTAESQKPGCQYWNYMSLRTHSAITALVQRHKGAQEAEKREQEAGLSGGGGGGEVMGGAGAVEGVENAVQEGASSDKPATQGTEPVGQHVSGSKLPSEIVGPDLQVSRGIGSYTMKLDYRIVGDSLQQLVEGFRYTNYHWERYDITDIVQKGLAKETEAAVERLAAAPTSEEAEVDPLTATKRRAEHAAEKLAKEASGAANELMHPVEASSTQEATDVVSRIYSNVLNLEYLPVSVITNAGGQALGALADLVGGPAQHREVTFPRKGFYLLRCVARPSGGYKVIRPASVATKVIRVVEPEVAARNAIAEPEAQAAEAEVFRELATDPEEKARQEAKRARQETFAKGSVVAVLEKRLEEKTAELAKASSERAKAAVNREIDILKEQIKKARAHKGETPDKDVHRLRAAMTSTLTGETYPLLLMAVPLPSEDKDVVRYKVVDTTSRDVKQYVGVGSSMSEAIFRAARLFAGSGPYGQGKLAVTIPEDHPEPERLEVFETTALGPAQTRERINDLLTVLTTLGLFVSGLAPVAAGLGAVVAAERLYQRWASGNLRLDEESVGDVFGVLGAIGMAASQVGKLATLKFVRSSKVFVIAAGTADDAKLLEFAEKLGQKLANPIAKATELIGQAGMMWGAVSIFGQLMQIQQDELKGEVGPAEARRRRFQILLGAIRDNAVPLYILRGTAAKGGALPDAPAKTPPKTPPAGGTPDAPHAAPGDAPHSAPDTGMVKPDASDPSRVTPDHPQAVKLGEGLTGKEKVSAHVLTPDGLHDVAVLEDGRIIRCSKVCAEILAHYEDFLKEESDPKRVEKAAAYKKKLETLKAEAAAAQDKAQHKKIAEEAAAVDAELRQFSAERLAKELGVKSSATETLLKMVNPEQVRALRGLLGDDLFRYLAGRKDPNTILKAAEAVLTAPTDPDRQAVIDAVGKAAKSRTGEAQLAKELDRLAGAPEAPAAEPAAGTKPAKEKKKKAAEEAAKPDVPEPEGVTAADPPDPVREKKKAQLESRKATLEKDVEDNRKAMTDLGADLRELTQKDDAAALAYLEKNRSRLETDGVIEGPVTLVEARKAVRDEIDALAKIHEGLLTKLDEVNEALAPKQGLLHRANTVHPISKIPYDAEGFPIFQAAAEVKLVPRLYEASDGSQFLYCNKQLNWEIASHPDLKRKFTPEQLLQIAAGENPKGYTWHHHQEKGRMQLVPSLPHDQTPHVGGASIWGGRTERREASKERKKQRAKAAAAANAAKTATPATPAKP
ncbi:MAG TPA: DUF4157 domain-containing protein [Thermoanaerobaculia bacterium]|nr:DUF4157 domain-containing protein [Thermoanaerobaculia bacterium]